MVVKLFGQALGIVTCLQESLPPRSFCLCASGHGDNGSVDRTVACFAFVNMARDRRHLGHLDNPHEPRMAGIRAVDHRLNLRQGNVTELPGCA